MAAPKIIGVTGYAKSGKDTFYSLLKLVAPARIRRYAFADQLKDDLDVISHRMFQKKASVLNAEEKEIFRPILISYGCAWRTLDPIHWVRIVQSRIEWDTSMLYSDAQPILPVITDIRFFNEFSFLREKYGKDFVMVEISRDGAPTPPDEELRNQPALSQAADFKINWPTLFPDRQAELARYVKDFVDTYDLAT